MTPVIIPSPVLLLRFRGGTCARIHDFATTLSMSNGTIYASLRVEFPSMPCSCRATVIFISARSLRLRARGNLKHAPNGPPFRQKVPQNIDQMAKTNTCEHLKFVDFDIKVGCPEQEVHYTAQPALRTLYVTRPSRRYRAVLPGGRGRTRPKPGKPCSSLEFWPSLFQSSHVFFLAVQPPLKNNDHLAGPESTPARTLSGRLARDSVLPYAVISMTIYYSMFYHLQAHGKSPKNPTWRTRLLAAC